MSRTPVEDIQKISIDTLIDNSEFLSNKLGDYYPLSGDEKKRMIELSEERHRKDMKRCHEELQQMFRVMKKARVSWECLRELGQKTGHKEKSKEDTAPIPSTLHAPNASRQARRRQSK